MTSHRERIREAREAERRVLAANNARAVLAHERKALAVLAAVEDGEDRADLGLNPVTVDQLVEEARQLAPVPPGRLGRSPEHVAYRYAAGEISREELIEALATWPYVPSQPISEGLWDDYASFTPGSFDEVQRAANLSYIDDDTFEEIVQRFAQRFQ
ncbi:hypothetical protein VR41_00115 [Streptomyces sp. NRRL B-1568]|nr:hypothetical protein VR41_00115 [Streptomyces sp. NRRL B-1568]